jgi:polysaccharide export outer membrane protein
MPDRRTWLTTLLLIAISLPLLAQQAPGGAGQTPANGAQQNGAQPATNGAPPAQQLPAEGVRSNYVLGPNDQIQVRAPEAEEIDQKPFRVDADGNIRMPLVGTIHAAGMTLQELEAELEKRLRDYIREPHVFVTMAQFRSEPVFFVGLFARPGIYPLQGSRTLTEMLTVVGGTSPNASRHLTIQRKDEYGRIPLANAVYDPVKKISTVEISLGSLTQNVNPAENIVLQPYDVVNVGRAEGVYVNGDVGRTGNLELGERESMSMLQALAQSGGLTNTAKKTKVRILRPILGTNRRYAIYVDADALLAGKGIDIPLLPDDIVYVPHSYEHQFWQTFSSVAIPIIPYVIFLVAQ